MPYRRPISPPESTCSEFLECVLANPDPVQFALLVAAASVVLLFLTLAFARIAGARSLLDEERTRIANEAEAFATFARRVADVDVVTAPVTDGGPTTTMAIDAPKPDGGIETVREAYRDTVMSVPHYESEYDESLATNMGLEFGEAVADAVDRGTTLTPQLKETLVEQSRTARRQRMALLRQLGSECEILEEAETTLRPCRRSANRLEEASLEDYSFGDLTAEWRLLGDRLEAAETLLEDRQELVQKRERDTGVRPDDPSFEQYLYDPMDVTYPILSEATSLVERIESARRRVERSLAARS